jgi:membrane-associated protease RseP (regulator of RpoE activity)
VCRWEPIRSTPRQFRKVTLPVSSNLPEGFPSETTGSGYTQIPEIPLPERTRAWREWLLPVVLFAATLLTATFAGLLYVAGDAGFLTLLRIVVTKPSILVLGLPFSATLLTILLAHELGHFFACRYYGISCTPPFFIPVPIGLAGTLGAFIRIKSPFQHKRALFDVGVAGPLAGFILSLPALVAGIGMSRLIPRGHIHGDINFGEPLIFRWIGKLVLGYSPATQDMIAHPVAMAAWFGLLATCLNLFPIWQLDGGHIAYAVLGPRLQRKISIAGTIALILVSFVGWPFPSYLLFGLILLVVGARFRFYHPPTLCDQQELDSGRLFVALLALVILLVCFTPVPISLS